MEEKVNLTGKTLTLTVGSELAWMPECMKELAAIQMVKSSGDSSQRETWHRDVAQALASADQLHLDLLFANPAYPIAELNLFKVSLLSPNGTSLDVMCDHKGQPLIESFWMTNRHRVNDLTSFML
jgi:hypothetical protein